MINNIEKKLKEFIETHHEIVNDYQQLNYKYKTSLARSEYEKICILFMNALEASGGPGHLDRKHSCYKKFKIVTANLARMNNIEFSDFANCFNGVIYKEPSDVKTIIKHLIDNKDFRDFDVKKAKLFIKELILYAGKDVFNNFYPENFVEYLEVPIDVVIRKVYGTIIDDEDIVKIDKKNREIFDISKAKKNYDSKINKLANNLFKDNPVMLDDLWFWGHFVFLFDSKKRTGPNMAMIETDRIIPYMNYKDKLNDLFSEFNGIITNKYNA